LVDATLSASKELRSFLSSPILKDEKKKDILNALFADKVSNDTSEFLNFVLEKKRVEILPDIVRRFNEIRDQKLGIANAVISTATEMDESSKGLLKTQIEAFTNKKLRVNFKTDESIIGGFTVKVSDKVIDASLRNQLAKLKKTLLSEKISIN
jgi:F-type H+-transporting ATPase subunit delta